MPERAVVAGAELDALVQERDDLRSALIVRAEHECDPIDGRYVVLADDGSFVSTDELMDGDLVLIDWMPND